MELMTLKELRKYEREPLNSIQLELMGIFESIDGEWAKVDYKDWLKTAFKSGFTYDEFNFSLNRLMKLKYIKYDRTWKKYYKSS